MTAPILSTKTTALQRKTTTARVVALLRDQILSGALPEGLQLRQEKLAAELGVSRVPIREALHQLEAEGLVLQESHKGAVVSGLSIDDLEETYEIRARLETWLLELSSTSPRPRNCWRAWRSTARTKPGRARTGISTPRSTPRRTGRRRWSSSASSISTPTAISRCRSA